MPCYLSNCINYYLISCYFWKCREIKPKQILIDFFPDFHRFSKILSNVFGHVSFVQIDAQSSELDPQALKCVFIGYSPTKKGYKCYYPTSMKFFILMEATFIENRPFSLILIFRGSLYH